MDLFLSLRQLTVRNAHDQLEMRIMKLFITCINFDPGTVSIKRFYISKYTIKDDVTQYHPNSMYVVSL